MPGPDDVIRRLRAAGISPGMRQPGASLTLDPNERALIDRITNSNDAQVALAKQQMTMNFKQFEANERNQEIAQAQWLLVYAADIFKFCVANAVSTRLGKAAEATILRALEDDGRTANVPYVSEAVSRRLQDAREAVKDLGHEQAFDASAEGNVGGFVERVVEHEPTE